MNSKLRTLALVALVAVGAFTGAAAAASNGSLTASPATASETSTHTATLTAGNDSTGSLNGFQVDYSDAGVDVSNVGVENVRTVGIDEDDDSQGATIDQNVSDDLESASESNNGETVTFQFGGSYSLDAGDEVVVVFENVQNGAAGEYEIALDINPQSSGGEGTATLTLDGDSSAGDSTEESADDSTEEPTDDSDDEQAVEDTEGGDSESTSTDGPGFGVALTVLALLGAAFVATRREN